VALTDAELARVKYHLGYNLLTVGALPYVGYVSLFDQVIQPYLTGGAATTSSTAVTAADEPTAVTLTLASATGFVAGDTCLVDVDSKQERVTIRALSGSTITVLLSFAHSGTYPVVVEGPEALVRSLLKKADEAQTALNDATSSAGIKQLGQGEIEWFGSSDGSLLSSLRSQLGYWRDELASALGIVRLNKRGGGGCVSLY
jgi:hypothetical protein